MESGVLVSVNIKHLAWTIIGAVLLGLAAPSRSFEAPKMQTITLSNGIEVDFAPYQKGKDVRVTMTINAGNGGDPKVPPYTVPTALRFATWGGDAADGIRETLARYNAGMSAECGPSTCFVELLAQTDTLDGALQLMSDIVRTPPFSQERFAEVRDLTADAMTASANKNDPARMILVEKLYGIQHPISRDYARPGVGDQIRRLSFDDLMGAYRRWVRPDNVRLLVVGDITPKHVQSMFERHFGDWRAPAAAISPLASSDTPAPSSTAQVFLFDDPTAERVSISAGTRFAHPTPKHYLDFSTLFVASRVLSARLYQSLHASGASMAAAAVLATTPYDLSLEMTFNATPANYQQTLVVARKTYEELISGRPPEPAEMERARREASSLVEQRFAAGDANALMTYYREQLVLDFQDHPYVLVSRYSPKVTPKGVQQLMRDHNATAALTWVVVGNAKVIEEAIRKLNLGEVTVVPHL
jgi:zinc protease